MCFFPFCKRKTADEVRISDRSSDVCSSVLLITRFFIDDGDIRRFLVRRLLRVVPLAWLGMLLAFAVSGDISIDQIGRASCRERVCQDVENSVVDVAS